MGASSYPREGKVSMTHIHFVEDERGDLVDLGYYCSRSCYVEAGHTDAGAWPGGMETDSDVHCETCGDFMWQGLES